MDYDKIDVLSTSQGRPTKDASLGATYRTIRGRPAGVFWGRPQDVLGTFYRATIVTDTLTKYFSYLTTGFLCH